MGSKNILTRDYQRPAGYAAHTRLHFGRMCIPISHDSGATCNCIPEEQLILILNHANRMVESGQMKLNGYNYPVRRLYHYEDKKYLRGASAHHKSTLGIVFAVVLRLEFIPEGCASGPTKDIFFKVFEPGCCNVVGIVLGWPV